jgi:hypothetical protein
MYRQSEPQAAPAVELDAAEPYTPVAALSAEQSSAAPEAEREQPDAPQLEPQAEPRSPKPLEALPQAEPAPQAEASRDAPEAQPQVTMPLAAQPGAQEPPEAVSPALPEAQRAASRSKA